MSALLVVVLRHGRLLVLRHGGEPPSYETSDAVQAQVLPQLAANGEDPEAAADAAWVVDATIADVEEGTTVTLVGENEDGGWETSRRQRRTRTVRSR